MNCFFHQDRNLGRLHLRVLCNISDLTDLTKHANRKTILPQQIQNIIALMHPSLSLALSLSLLCAGTRRDCICRWGQRATGHSCVMTHRDWELNYRHSIHSASEPGSTACSDRQSGAGIPIVGRSHRLEAQKGLKHAEMCCRVRPWSKAH